MASIICKIGGPHYHESVAAVRSCHEQNYGALPPIEQAGMRPTSEERAWADTVVSQRLDNLQPGTESRGADRYEEQWDEGPNDHANFKKRYTATDPHPGYQDGRADERGLYLLKDKIYKLVPSQGTGRLYAKQLVQKEEGGKFIWAYAKGVVYDIKRKHKLTAEQASEFGEQFGVCVNCFADLTRGESVRRGYGPKCAENHGWPYDHSSTD